MGRGFRGLRVAGIQGEQMSTALHTPGPWELETVKTSAGICHKIGPFPGTCGREVGHACVYVDGLGVPDSDPKRIELLANARLIAAAPDLLAACEELKAAFMDGCGDAKSGPKRLRLVKAGSEMDKAIAKAKGGAS